MNRRYQYIFVAIVGVLIALLAIPGFRVLLVALIPPLASLLLRNGYSTGGAAMVRIRWNA